MLLSQFRQFCGGVCVYISIIYVNMCVYIYIYWYIKTPFSINTIMIMLGLRFHLCVMRMTNATKYFWKHRISLAVLPFVWMQMRSMMTTKWISSWAIGANVNVLSDWKSLYMHDCLKQGKTTLVPWYHSSFAIVVIFALQTSGILA